MYNLDLIYNIYMILPPLLRNPVLVYFIAALLEPVRTLHESFMNMHDEIIYNHKFTGQVIYMERLLSLEFGDYTITIVDGQPDSGSFIGHYPVSNMVLAHYDDSSAEVYHYNAALMVDFIVQVPAMLYDDMSAADFDRMEAIIEKYKLINKTYEIQKI